MTTEQWLRANACSLHGQRVAITGSTGGLGQELCAYLAQLGASLVLLDRNEQKSRQLQKRLSDQYPGLDICCISVDLEKIETVWKACAALRECPPDILIHNAGAYSIPRYRCSTGYDNVFQINFVSPYCLIRALLPVLEQVGTRVIVVGSIAHTYSLSDPEDVDFSTRRSAGKVYGNAKRYLMFAMYELFSGCKNASLSVVHPGITLTGITAHYPKWLFALIKWPMKVIFMSPRRAALCLLRGVYDSCGYHEWIGPRVAAVWGLPVKRRLHTCSGEESRRIGMAAEAIWLQVKSSCKGEMEQEKAEIID